MPLYTQGVSNRKYVDGVSRNSCPRLRFAKYFTCESCQWRLAAYRVYRNVSMTFVFGLVSRFPPTDEYRIDFDFTASFTGIILCYRIDESGGRVLIANFCQFDQFSPSPQKKEKRKKRKEKIQLGYFFSSTFEIFLSNMICNLKKFNFQTRKLYAYIMYNVKFTNRIYNC